ncbi:MAG: HipA N-terminal domain-containing protein [Clostridium sp.]|nr:HipA N-terminal domain-containing protein [Clostridium sp.]
METLDIFYNDIKAGALSELQPGRHYIFKYEPDYLKSEFPPISATLPKQKEEFESDLLFPFFANMIPEGINRRVICRALRIDEKNLFGILSAMSGKDFIGAVNIRISSHD